MDLATFLAKWSASGGAERANKDSFLRDLCDVLGVPHPDPKTGDSARDAYVFERDAKLHHPDGSYTTGFIDLYKRGCFLLEAKQGSDVGHAKTGTAKRGTGAWFTEMDRAVGQARNYAESLPAGEPLPPFLVTCDIGLCFELYAQFDGTGEYRPFPNAPNKRIYLRDLEARPELVEMLRAVFVDPHGLDPSKRSANVTRAIAEDLAALAGDLEKAGHPAESVATFLMRCIFTMFAEDVGLLPERMFTDALEQHWIPNPAGFPVQIETLWRAMNEGTSFGFVGKLLRFNGGLFASPTSLPLKKPDLEKLHRAAKHDWSQVEPAIFGTLLERALSDKERHKLGAHYTPRAYVERLVKPTIEEPLRAEWDVVRTQVRTLVEAGKTKDAIAATHGFHHKLVTTRVLDPACGSGNFLYVTLDLFKRLEGEVLALLHDLGETQELLETERVTPAQFLGIEVKRWAKEIAELVLWIGYLQWHYRTHGRLRPPPEPVLQNYGNIECRDAVLAWDRVELVVDEHGKPRTRWDGETFKRSPVTGEQVPDEIARVPVERYVNPRRAEWPRADFVVGNPPFLGKLKIRAALGDAYVDAVRSAYSAAVPDAADFVMYWWWRAAECTRSGASRRFGFVTTNSISQTLNQQVVAAQLAGVPALALAYALPDHPWVDDGAAVRVAMTVGAPSPCGRVTLAVTVDERDESVQVEERIVPALNSNLTVGADVTRAARLRSNAGLSHVGVGLHGRGFFLEIAEGRALLEASRNAGVVHAERYIRRTLNGRDLAQQERGGYLVDLHGVAETELRSLGPIYQRVLDRVKPERDQNRRELRRRNWWLFGENAPNMRTAVAGCRRYIATAMVAKHRVVQFLDATILPEQKIVVIAIEDAYALGVLTSRAHVPWALAAGGWLGVGNDSVYSKSRGFEPFPFPAAAETQQARIRALGEQLDAHRKRQLAQHSDLTITGMYNVLEKLRAGTELTEKERVVHEHGLVSILKQIHDELDDAVSDAYGWPRDLTDEQILVRLVALNAERAEEERSGLVRWLRPDFQNPGGKVAASQVAIAAANEGEEEGEEGAASAAAPKAAPWPKKLPERIAAVRDLVAGSRGAWTLAQVVATFGGAKRPDVAAVLESLAALGIVVGYDAGAERRYRAAARVAA
jgi:hypothetical protein